MIPTRVVALLLVCISLFTAQQPAASTHRNKVITEPAAADATRLAKMVTIYRDTYGVPHVFGRTDAATVFGFAYAQAEDSFWRVEENFILALGRASELYGEKTLDG